LTALTQDIQSVKDELLQTFVSRRTTDVPGRLE
jgi:hypothetical protein